jgi:hypothetical protein
MKKVLIALATAVAFASPALADGFSATLSAGTSPIAQAFSVRGVLAYSTTITSGLTLSGQARVNYNSASGTFGLSFRATPKYTLSLLESIALSVRAFGGVDFLIRVLPTPVGLYVTPLVGADLTYALSDPFAIYAGTEFDLSFNFDGAPISAAPFLSFYLEGDYTVIDPLTIAVGANFGTNFGGFYYNPYLNLSYDLDSTIRLILEGGYDNGGFLANTNGSYIFLRGRFRF